jgi:hypothetical protein
MQFSRYMMLRVSASSTMARSGSPNYSNEARPLQKYDKNAVKILTLRKNV